MVIAFLLCILSVFTFILFAADKRRAVAHKWRISERMLLCFSFFGGIGGLLGMIFFHHKTRKWRFKILVPLFAFVDATVIAFFLWSSVYYAADISAESAMISDDTVTVEKTEAGWLSAYEQYYMAGHSLGGAMAADYAAEHESHFDGIILFGAYPTKETNLDTLLIYGSEDGVLNRKRVENASSLVSGKLRELVIDGGNHAQFGNYGEQRGDGKAGISGQDQQNQAVEAIREFING